MPGTPAAAMSQVKTPVEKWSVHVDAANPTVAPATWLVLACNKWFGALCWLARSRLTKVRVWLVGAEKAGSTASPVLMAATANRLAMMSARFI